MILCRFEREGRAASGVVEDHAVWTVEPDFYSDWEKTGESFPLDQVRLLAPCAPSKIIAVGLNYRDHIREFDRDRIPEEPVLFLKAPSALIGPGDSIVLPPGAGRVDYEAEAGVVIGRRCRNVSESEAASAALGVVCVNDVTARALQKKDGQWTRAKSFDTFAPIGPWIAAGLPLQSLRVEARLNGKTVQQASTADMIFPIARLIAFVSSVMTLYPGDLISTGTPQGVGPLSDGDQIDIFVEGVGILRNPVAGKG